MAFIITRSTPLAWLLGLSLALAGSLHSVGSAVSAVSAQAKALNSAGIAVVPAGTVLQSLTAPELVLGGALMIFASAGLLACLLGHVAADLLGRRRSIGLAALAALGLAWLASSYSGAWLAWTCFVVLLMREPRPSGPSLRAWPAALALILPLGYAAQASDWHSVRDRLNSSVSGQVLVEHYYRYTLHAAAAIKAPAQRLYRSYTWTREQAAPAWLSCAARERMLLPSATGNLQLRAGADDSIMLAGRLVHADEFGEHLDSALAAADDALLLRAATRAGLLGGLPLIMALLMAHGALRLSHSRGTRIAMPVAALLTGSGLAYVLLAAAPVKADGPAARTAFAMDPATPLVQVRARAMEDPSITVRASALRVLVTRANPPQAMLGHIRAAPSWYEQWHGYRALLERQWRPLSGGCDAGF